MKRFSVLYPIKFILAFCSIVYELLLAQSLSAFMEDTVLRYSVTIGLYMFSLGAGAWITEGRMARNAALTLSGVELSLTAVGSGSVALLYMFGALNIPRLLFAVCAHLLIIAIGVLTGMEIPLLTELRNKEKEGAENFILAADYAGAFTGTIVFAFVFYSRMGLVAAAFLTGFLNAATGVLLITQRDKVQGGVRYFKAAIAAQVVLGVLLIIFFRHAAGISEYFYRHYTR